MTSESRLRPGRLISVVASLLATGAAIGLMSWARSAYQIRTPQERIMEWTLLFVPTDLFESGLQRFGTSAKVLALDVTIAGIAVALFVFGLLAVRRSVLAIVLTAGGLWLFAMAVVMPLTGAGFFATGLFQDVALTNASYLVLAFAYGTLLLAARALALARPVATGPGDWAVVLSRRALVGGVAGTGLAYALTFWLGRSHGLGGSSVPVASVADLPTEVPPTPVPATPPAATPTASGDGSPGPAAPTGLAAAAPPAIATPAPPTATPRPVIPPAPAPRPPIHRAEDGATNAAGRKPGELAPFITRNDAWYITTKNAIADPVVDPAKWRLIVDGEVGKPVQLDLPLMYQLPAVEITKTLECISNRVTRCGEAPFGCDLISNAKWKGARLRDVLALAGGLKPGVRSIVFFCADEFTASVPADPETLDKILLVYEMNGTVLPIEHGYPVRMLIPNLYGMKNPKWIVNIRPMATDYVDWYGQRGWSKQGIVRTMARIDTPAEGQKLPPGDHPIAGIAYAGARGLSKVEYSADGGKTWTPATAVEPYVGPDTWLRWEGKFTFEATQPADLVVRCVDGTGQRQTEPYTPVAPDGQAGLDQITIYPA